MNVEEMEIYILRDGDCNDLGAYNDIHYMYNDFVKYYADQYPQAKEKLLKSPFETEDILKFFSDIAFMVEVYLLQIV